MQVTTLYELFHVISNRTVTKYPPHASASGKSEYQTSGDRYPVPKENRPHASSNHLCYPLVITRVTDVDPTSLWHGSKPRPDLDAKCLTDSLSWFLR